MNRALTTYRRLLAVMVAVLPVWVLVVGLLTIPTVCRCGADLPHAHTLFEIPGHAHAPGRHDHGHGHAHEHEHHALPGGSGDVETIRSGDVALTWGSAIALWATIIALPEFGRTVMPWHSGQRLSGLRRAPGPPPPKLATA
uniref:Uncharacterized protein n=2 Tax=Thermorudis TaxID=1649508 RepID=A0A7C2WCK1_9BACT